MSRPARRPPAVERVVSELLQVVDGIVPTNVRRDLEASLERLREERANLVVLGEFKRGKSTLANALVGAEIVPTGVLPLTAMVTAIRHGPAPRVVVIFESGERLEIGEGQVADFATEAGNPGNVRGAKLSRSSCRRRCLPRASNLSTRRESDRSSPTTRRPRSRFSARSTLRSSSWPQTNRSRKPRES